MKKNVILLMVSIVIVYIISNIEITKGSDAESSLQQHLAEKIVRFHIVANSDSQEDQELKLLVKDAVITYIKPLLENSGSLDETRQIIDAHRDEILATAREVIEAEGYDYDISMSYENCYFPVKTYGDITFPAGYYNAVNIRIGASNGKNWWCVLYPPLCFVDAVHGVVPDQSKKQLEQILGYQDYQALIYGIHDDSYQVTYKFRFLTFLN